MTHPLDVPSSEETIWTEYPNRMVCQLKDGRAHCEDGPAVRWNGGTLEWWRYGKPHRTDGPAIETSEGHKRWMVNNALHREDGPAVDNADGHREWWVNGHRHRTDGPAVEHRDGDVEWWMDGRRLFTSDARVIACIAKNATTLRQDATAAAPRLNLPKRKGAI